MSDFRNFPIDLSLFLFVIMIWESGTSHIAFYRILCGNIQCMPVLIISGSAGYGKLLSNNQYLAIVDAS